MGQRSSGILLHITSLPSPYGIGDLGSYAYRFVDFLAKSKQSLWQLLPLTPTTPVLGNSPYNSFSAFAGNKILISPDLLVEEGFLSASELERRPHFSTEKVDYLAATEFKEKILGTAYEGFKNRLEQDKGFQKFCHENSFWLDDYALFVALKDEFQGAVWSQWPKELRDRKTSVLKEWYQRLHEKINAEKFFQYLFFGQWRSLKDYCRKQGVKIIGDIPIYVSYDSSDVWANPAIFKLDEHKRPTHLAGVPPDYFSETGQLWGNPVYNWNVLAKSNFSWWLKRFEQNFNFFDLVRVDHFRGFVSYWEVPASEKNAVKGQWTDIPAEAFFQILRKHYSDVTIIAEDLGIITDEVRKIMRQFGFPGMKVLLFAFDGNPAENPYIPHNHIRECVIYTGTHDNNTVRGWFEREASAETKKKFFHYLGRSISVQEISWEFVRLAMMSVADTAILAMQDVLGLGEEARMNKPGTTQNNWQWRLLPDMLTPLLVSKLIDMTEIYARS